MENILIKGQFNRIDKLLDVIRGFILSHHDGSEKIKYQNDTKKTLSEKISDLRYLINEKSKILDVCSVYEKAECKLKEFKDSLNLIESGSCTYNKLKKSFLELKQNHLDIRYVHRLVRITNCVENFYAHSGSMSYRLEKLNNLLRRFDALAKTEKCLREICKILEVQIV